MATAPKPKQTILVVDDEPSLQRYMQTLLELDNYRVEIAANGAEAVSRIQKGPDPDLVFLDVLMPELDGLQALEKMRKLKPQLKVVMLSCVSDTPKVVLSMRLGAQDYLTKPFEKHELDNVIARCIGSPSGEVEISAEVEDLGEDLFFLAAAPAMKKIASEVALIANVDIPVLMLGESGTGKEIIARLIHKRSARAQKPFVKVNCAALPGDLLESELFGYEPGAFTGANKSKPGKFEQCNRGTLMLDEVGEMPVQLQAKLLHVLQDGEFSRLGSRASIKVDVRVLAATNIDVQKSIANKTFREDLYYRLNAFTVNVPPLRARKEEIPFLLRHYMNRMAESYGRTALPLSPRLIEACKEAAWPGNVRELSNFVKRYLILGDEDLALAELVRSDAAARPPVQPVGPLKDTARGAKTDAEADAILRALQQTGWNKKRAADVLKISYKALLYKIQEYGIKAPRPSAVKFKV